MVVTLSLYTSNVANTAYAEYADICGHHQNRRTEGREAGLARVNETSSPQYISVGFVAKNCGVSNTTVLRWITAGQLPAFRLPGSHYRINKDDFSLFLT